MSNNKRAVVTGGAGFIGSHLAEELARRGYQVIIFDDLSTGKLENIAPLSNARNSMNSESSITQQTGVVCFIKGSVTNSPLLREILRGVDFVFHQAAIPSVPRSVENPLASHEANITGTLNVLLAAGDNGFPS